MQPIYYQLYDKLSKCDIVYNAITTEKSPKKQESWSEFTCTKR